MAKFSSTVIIGGEEHIPFQLQIEYTGTDKSRYLRVFTKTMPATTDLQRADDGMQMISNQLAINTFVVCHHKLCSAAV